MNATCERLFDWLLRSSWQASILVLLVIAVQWLSGKRLGPSWKAALWLLVLLKLMLPVSPQASFSLFNLASSRMGERSGIGAQLGGNDFRPSAGIVVNSGQPLTLERGTSKADLLAVGKTIAWILWLVGAGLLATRMVWQAARFSVLLKRAPRVNDPPTIEIFESAKHLLGVRSATLVQTDLVDGPAVYGYFSPRVLLPRNMASNFSAQELRHVFLHELAHVKRQDMLMLWIGAVLKILHWFNPILWLGFRRLAADRELACDELALSYAEEGEKRSYGETILRLLQACAGRRMGVVTAGILEDRSQVLQRISMIASFRKGPRWSYSGIFLIAILGLVTLTEARQEGEASPSNQDPSNGLIKSETLPPATADPLRVQNVNSETDVLAADQGDASPALPRDIAQNDQIRTKLDETSTNVLQKPDSELADHHNAAGYRDLQSLRDEIQSLEKRKADLERQIQAEEARSSSNRTTVSEDAFRQRYGVARTDVPSPGTNAPGAQDLARAQARDAFLRRYGLAPNHPRTVDPSTNSNQEARDAFRRRYGLMKTDTVSPEDPFHRPTGLAPRTGISSENLPLRIAIDAKGALRLGNDGQPVTLDEVRAKLHEEAKRNPALKLSIVADRNAPFGQIIKVMDAAKEANLKNVNAVTDDIEVRSESLKR